MTSAALNVLFLLAAKRTPALPDWFARVNVFHPVAIAEPLIEKGLVKTERVDRRHETALVITDKGCAYAERLLATIASKLD